MGIARIGCSGWNYRDWRGSFYPQAAPARRWLELYALRLKTVEVNATFYRLPSREAVAHWVQQTPAGFELAVKASRYLTHVKRLRDLDDGTTRLYERIEPLLSAGRLGPILWQLPPGFARDDDRLADALARLPSGRHALEFRHESWFAPEVLALLRAHHVALVLADDPRRDDLSPGEATTDWRYVRMHHGRRGRHGNYSAAELDSWAARVRGWLEAGDVYVYFNNDWHAFAPHNALGLAKRVSRAEPLKA